MAKLPREPPVGERARVWVAPEIQRLPAVSMAGKKHSPGQGVGGMAEGAPPAEKREMEELLTLKLTMTGLSVGSIATA